MKITYAQLRQLGACKDHLVEFERRFGASVEVTERVCVEHASVFDWDWAASKLLTSAAREAYEAAVAPAALAIASAREEYEAAVASAREAYEAARATAFARSEVKAVVASAREGRDRASLSQ